METYRFKKEERLCSSKLIESLFSNGSSFILYPFRISFLSVEAHAAPAQVLISVPKRRFKKAADRNKLKRRIREAYRLHKSENLYDFLAQHQQSIILSIQYIGKGIHDYVFLQTRLIEALNKLHHEYTQVYLGEAD